MKEEFCFKTRARVIEQLGFQLIKNENIALLELIKNSYDADANSCIVIMSNLEDPEKGEIIIQDDGEGMDKDILLTAWLEIGTSYKNDLLADDTTIRSSKYKRFRLGEKGIGRFGVHRLGSNIEIITRKSGSDEFVLKINWDQIENSKYVEDIPVSVIKRKPEIFKNGSGTLLKIKKLRTPWNRNMIRVCYRAILSLNSPFESMDSFKAELNIDKKEWIKDLLQFDEIEDWQLFSFDVKMKGRRIIKFKYNFTPWDIMKKLNTRTITIKDKEIKPLTKMVYYDKKKKKTIDINLNKYKIGTIKFEGIIFDRGARVLELGMQDKKGLKEYLDYNGGIRVYRDNMRVLDYGEPANDWLKLGERRVNMPATRISNNIMLSAVYLNREESKDLIEKTNREGFIENDAYCELVRAIFYVIKRVESLRKIDKDLLWRVYGEQKINEPVISSVTELKAVVEKKVKQEKLRNDIMISLDRIENEYVKITETLIKSAGAGLNLIMVIHEMGKLISLVIDLLNKKAKIEIIHEQVEKLAKLIEGYSILIKKSEKKNRNLKGILDEILFLLDSRFERHKIKIIKTYRLNKKNLDAICSKDHLTNAIMNIMDNAIWWLEYAKEKKPQIYIDISDDFKGYRSIVIADNGPGFTLPVTEIIKPFVSEKPEDVGMGIGLHLTDQIMISLGGKLFFPENDFFNIPETFYKGAQLALALKKGSK